MAGIKNMMNLGKGALMAHQQRMATHQHNVSNASTPGYRRERVQLQTLGSYTGVPLQGVRAGYTESVSAPLVDRVVPEKRGEVAYHSTIQEAGLVVESLTTEDALNDRLSEFFAGARSLEVDGQSLDTRQDFLIRAKSLANTIRGRHDSLQFQREINTDYAEESVNQLNQNLQELEMIENEMMINPNAPELIDARDQLVNSISDMTGTRVVPDASGRVSLVTSSGTALFEGGRAREVSFESTAQGFSYKVGNNKPLDDVGGKLGGLLQADRDIYQGSINRLNEFASAFANEVNTLHSQGVGLDGSTGQELFIVSAQGAASTIAINDTLVDNPKMLALSDDTASLPGGSQVAFQMAELEEQQILNGQTPNGLLTQDALAVGKSIAFSAQHADAAASALNQAESIQASVSGVSLEEEMLSLAEAQRAYEASVKIVQTADEMMQTILALK